MRLVGVWLCVLGLWATWVAVFLAPSPCRLAEKWCSFIDGMAFVILVLVPLGAVLVVLTVFVGGRR